MKLHIMASLRTNFSLNDEEVHAAPQTYQQYWTDVANLDKQRKDEGPGAISFLHAGQLHADELSRFRSVSSDSLSRPLHLMEVSLRPDDPEVSSVWNQVHRSFAGRLAHLDRIRLIKESVNFRIYNNCVALLQADIQIDDFVDDQPAIHIARDLDQLQEFAVTLGEQLGQQLYRQRLFHFLQRLLDYKHGKTFISAQHFEFGFAHDNAILTSGSTAERQLIRVNWVTRTLLVDAESEKNLAAVIAHWLKDCGKKTLIEQAKRQPEAYAVRWLNYLFREKAWRWRQQNTGSERQAAIDYCEPFADEWQAMLNAQYYYATFESLNDSLTSILAKSYRKQTKASLSDTSALRKLSRELERHVITANLAMLEYHNNYGYYKRDVGNTMKQIMKDWDFDEAILNEIKRKTELCEQRIDELHKKAESLSGFYSDLLLLGIALISVSAFLFQLIEYGRTMSHNADLAVYESNSWNLIQFISERPTDFVITLSLGLIVLLFVIYASFRRMKVMD